MPRDVRLPKANLTEDSYLTSHEVAHHLQVNPSSVNKWVKEERIPAHRTPGGHRRIRVSDLLAFLKTYEIPIPKGLDVGALPSFATFEFPKTDPLETALKSKGAMNKKGKRR